MKLKITKITPKKNGFGKNDFIVSMVSEYDDNGKYVKHLPLSDELCKQIEGCFIVNKEGDAKGLF